MNILAQELENRLARATEKVQHLSDEVQEASTTKRLLDKSQAESKELESILSQVLHAVKCRTNYPTQC